MQAVCDIVMVGSVSAFAPFQLDPEDKLDALRYLDKFHDRNESNYCQRFDCGQHRVVSATGSGSQQEGHDFGTSPRRRDHGHVDPQPFIEAGYYTEHHKFIVGAIRAGSRSEAILGWAYDFNQTWRAQLDFQSGSGNSVTAGFTCNLTRDFQFNPAIYVTNDSPHHVLGYIVFTYTFHLWNREKPSPPAK